MTALLLLAAMLLLSRPLLGAARPSLTIAMGAGAAMAWASPLAADAAPVILGVCGAWLAMAAAEPLGAGRGPGFGLRATAQGPSVLFASARLLLPSLLLGAAARAWPFALAPLFADPDATQRALVRTSRPDAAARRAPTLAGLALGFGLLGTLLMAPLPRIPLALAAGILLGLAAAGAARLARGREMTAAVLIAAALLGWALSARFALPAPAVLFVAGLILSRDTVRRASTFTTLREPHDTAALMMMAAAGAMLAAPQAWPVGWIPWGWGLALLAVRPLVLRQAWSMALSPLVILVALDPAAAPAGLHAGAALPIATAFAAGEILERLSSGSRRSS